MSRRRPPRSAPRSWGCEVICSDGHESSGVLVTLTYVSEDVWGWETVEDMIADRSTLQAKKGARVSAGGRTHFKRGYPSASLPSAMDTVREVRPDGGTKTRLRCDRCIRDLPISWPVLDRVVEKLYRNGVTRIELRH